MAPTPSPIVVSSSKRFHRLRRQALSFSHRPSGQSPASRIEDFKPRTLDTASQPSVVLEGPPPPPVPPASSGSIALAPVLSSTSTTNKQSGDIPGEILAAVVVAVLILGGLIGIVVGGQMLRRQTRTRVERTFPPRSKCTGRRKSKRIKNTARTPPQHTKTDRERFPHDEKTLTPLARPPPALDIEHQRRLSSVWPIRSMSRVLYNRQSCPELMIPASQNSSPPVPPQTTWSEFTPVNLYVPPLRTVLDRIPEEHEEDCRSQTNSDLEVVLGVAFQRSPESDHMVSTEQFGSLHTLILDDCHGPKPSETKERQGSRACRSTRNEDRESLESSAPDMTSDEGESSRSSMVSLGSLEDGHDRESLREEVFELRRAQTRSVQMNKGVLLSLSLKTLEDDQNFQCIGEELGCDPLQSPLDAGAEAGKDAELSLAMVGGGFSVVSLDEFPSPPSILPMIPSIVSGF